jgi:SAM-dependent methyltransferase
VVFGAADAENLPFVSAVFDLVTCRIAPHHFPDCFRFVQESARVLKPGGTLLVQDHVLANDEQTARYTDAFEMLRDPSHHRAFAQYEWEGMFQDAGLAIVHTEQVVKRHQLYPWAMRQGCSPEVIQQLEVMLTQAPPPVKDWMLPQHLGATEASFVNRHLIIAGKKPVH